MFCLFTKQTILFFMYIDLVASRITQFSLNSSFNYCSVSIGALMDYFANVFS